MSLDAIVWLVVGIGVGIGACFMLLMIYAGLERWRLGRRLRRAHILKTASSPEGAQAPAPAGSKLALLDEKKARGEQAPAASLVQATRARVEPVVQPVPKPETLPSGPDAVPAKSGVVESEPGPSRPAAPVPTVVRAEPEQPPIGEAVPLVDQAENDARETSPAPVAVAEAKPSDGSTAPTPHPPQTVEDMFAEAFALDKVAVAPLRGEKDDAG